MRIPIILLLFAGLCYYGGHRYTHHINHACCQSENGKVNTEKLFSRWSKDAVEKNDVLFGPYKDSIMVDFDKETDALKITGLYYSDEENNTKFRNLGIARANYIKKKFFKGYRNAINLDSRLLDGTLENHDATFRAAELARLKAEDVAARVEEKDGKIIFYFPFNASDPSNVDANILIYLDELSAEISETTQSVSLTGHTDSVGDDDMNMDLSNQRAETVKNILIANGIDAGRITTEGFGETMPQADNETDYGRKLNRRVELILND